MNEDSHKRRLIGKALKVYRDAGLVETGKRTASKVKNLLVRSNAATWYARELVQPPLPDRVEAAGSFSCVTPHALAQWLWQREDLAWAADIRELDIASPLEHPWTCWRRGGEIVAFCKLGSGRVFIVDFERVVSLPENFVFLSDIYVLPEARRKGIGRELLIATMNFLRQRSFSVLSCHIPESNRASAALFRSVGFHSYGKIRFLRTFGLPMFSIKPEQMLRKMAVVERNSSSGPAGH